MIGRTYYEKGEPRSGGHVAILPAQASPDVALAQLSKRFVCCVCGSRSVKAKRKA